MRAPWLMTVCLLALVLAAARLSERPDSVPSASARPLASASLARPPLGFVVNVGLADPWARHVALGDSTAVLFGPDGVSFRRSHPPEGERVDPADRECTADCPRSGPSPEGGLPAPDSLGPMAAGQRIGDPERGTVDALDLRFVGARADLEPLADAPTGATLNIFRGRRPDWRAGMSMYGRIVYPDAWPGIDIVWEGAPHRLKHSFVVRPGADPSAIVLAWHGADDLRVGAGGALEVAASGGTLVDDAPVAWQELGDHHEPLDVAYELRPSTGGGGSAYGFRVDGRDPQATLVVDPAVFVSASFVGTEANDRGLGVAVASDGDIFLAGEWGEDAMVARLSPDGTTLRWLSLLGGSSGDGAFDIAVDRLGSAVVTGATISVDFPVEGGPDLTHNGGAVDGFVTRLAPDGDIVWSGFFGGAGFDIGEGIAVDESGQVTVTGATESTERTFPVVVGPDLTHNGGTDTWVGRLRSDPTAARTEDNYAWSGFIGGAADDAYSPRSRGPWGAIGFLSSGQVALDGEGNAYVVGETTSDEATFPDGDGFGDVVGPDRTYNGGPRDAWIAKVRADGTGLAYAGYVGGDQSDGSRGVAVDAQGAAWLGGGTRSDERTFPVVGGPGLVYGGAGDAFICKVRPDGTGLEQCGYLGGDDADGGQGLALMPDGAPVVVGATKSNPDYFPVTGGPDLTYNSPDGSPEEQSDAFVGRLRPGVTSADPRRHWDFLGYIGGVGNDDAFWVGVAPSGRIVVVGDTDSDESSFPNGDGVGTMPGLGEPFHGEPNGENDAFVAVIDWAPEPSRAFLPLVSRSADRSALATSVPATLVPAPSATTTRLPTPTDVPTATATPTRKATPAVAVPTCETVVFADDFSDPASGWPIGEGESPYWRYVEDEYEVAASPRTYQGPLGPGVPLGDGAFEATVRLIENAGARAGLRFGLPNGFLTFDVRGDGRFELGHRRGGGFRYLVLPSASEHVRPLGEANRLRLELDGDRATLFANGHFLGAIEDPAIGEPGVAGLIVVNSTGARAVARFDDVLVTGWLPCRPTPTPLPPTPTRLPTPMVVLPPCEALVLADDFADPRSGWTVGGDDSQERRYVDGEYEILVQPAHFSRGSVTPAVILEQGAFEATVRIEENARARAGLRFGPSLVFSVTGEGRFELVQLVSGVFRNIVTATLSSHVRPFGAPNRLRLEIDGSRATLMANGEVLRVVNDPRIAEPGEIGLIVLNGTSTPATARFDDAVVTRWLACRPTPTPRAGAARTR